MRSSAAEAVAAARSYTSYSVGYCLRWVVTCWQAPSIGCPDAITSWEWATMKHSGDRDPPAGAPVYYRGGKHGHIAMSMGGGRIRSTDCQSSGVVSEVALNWPEKAWGYPYLGWTGDLSKVPLPLGTAPDEDEDMGEVQITYIDPAAANALSKAIWERYQPGGKNLATWLGEMGQDIEQIKNDVNALKAAGK
jgi:hypothetical protein